MNNNEGHWNERARCANVANPDIFFPPRDKLLYSKIASDAKKLCFGENGTSHCPVRAACLWDAISKDEQHGIWGGMSHRERNALVRKWERKYKKSMTLEEYVFSLEKKTYGK